MILEHVPIVHSLFTSLLWSYGREKGCGSKLGFNLVFLFTSIQYNEAKRKGISEQLFAIMDRFKEGTNDI